MLPTARQISPRSKFPDQPPSNQSVVPMFALAALLECIHEWHLIHKAFFEIAVAAQTKFKDADVIANAIGCAPLPEILFQNFLIPWLEQGLQYAPAKTLLRNSESSEPCYLQFRVTRRKSGGSSHPPLISPRHNQKSALAYLWSVRRNLV
jgi:hypothetical protein